MQSTERSTRSSKRYITEPAPDHAFQGTHTDTGQYMCIECSETFNNKLEFNTHCQSHVTKKQFTCSHCGRGFLHQVLLQMHERSHEVGISRSSPTKMTASRSISTRSTRPLLNADIIHVMPTPSTPSKSTYHLNSKVEFKKEQNASQVATPRECVTRRTHGTSPPAHQRADISDQKTEFELRISKLSDSTIHLIDPYGNTIEILAEVFNAYTIGEPDEDEEEEEEEEGENMSPTGDSTISEISAAPTSSTVHLNMADELADMAVSPQDLEVLSSSQVDSTETVEPTKADVMEEDLPVSTIQSVSSASISPKIVPDLLDNAEDVSSTQTPCESDARDVASDENIVNPLATGMLKNSEEEILTSSIQDTLITCGEKMDTEGSIEGDVSVCNNELAVVTTQTEHASLNLGVLDDLGSVQLEYSEVLRADCLNTEDTPGLTKPVSLETLINLSNQEKDENSISSHTSVTGNEMDPSLNVSTSISEVDLSSGINEDNGHLVTSFVENNQELKSDCMMSLSDIVTENNTLPENTAPDVTHFKGEELCRDAPLPSLDNSVPLLEDDRTELQTPPTLNECVLESDDHHEERLGVSSTRDPGGLELESDIQTDLSTNNMVCNTPVDDSKGTQNDETDENQTASNSELGPDLSGTDICRLNQEMHDEASYPVDIGSSEPNSQNMTSFEMFQELPDQRSVGLSDPEGDSLKRDHDDHVLISLEKQISESIIMPDKLPDIASGTVPILQEAMSPAEQCQELLGVEDPSEYINTDVSVLDPSQKNDDSWESNSDNDVGMSSPVNDVQPQRRSNDLEQDANLREDKKLEANDLFNMRHIESSAIEEKHGGQIDDKAPVVPPVELFSLTNIENTVEDSSSNENIQTSVHTTKCDVEKDTSFQKIPVESGEVNPTSTSLLESKAVSVRDGSLLPCNEDLSLTDYTESQDGAFSVQTLVSITSACVKAQERVLSQENKLTEQDAAASMNGDELRSNRSIENPEFKDDALLKKLEGEDSGTTLSLLERTLDLTPDLDILSEKCLLSTDEMKDLAENDIDKNLSHEASDKQYIQMSNADLTENDLADDFVNSGTILLDTTSLDEATKDDISAVSVDDQSTVHDLSDMLSPEIQDSEYTESVDEKHVGFGGQCLKCGRRVRRGRKEMVWFPICYKCRLKTKREERHAGEGTGSGLDRKKGSSDFSNFHIKQETDPAQDDAFYRNVKSVQSMHSIKQESSSLLRKMYKCPKCEKSFKLPAQLAGHMKCHALPQCLGCGCPMTLKYKTKRIPRRCHKCFQKLKQQKEEERALGGEDDSSLDSDSGSLLVDEADLQSLMDDDELENDPILSSTKLVEDPKPGGVKRGIEPFHSIFMRKRKTINPAIQALYCTCDVVLKSGVRQPKICKNCQKPVRERFVHGPTADGKVAPLKKTKKQPPSVSDQQNLQLGESSMSLENELSPDEFCKEENESFTELDMSDQMVLPDGEKPRLCSQCGKIFKCNRSMNLHVLSHTASQCESCGCRLQKKKRGRWSKKCRVCRLLSKDKGVPDGSIDEVPPSDKMTKEKNVAFLRQKMKKSKIVRSSKIQSIAKHKKELKWMNMILAVKGLTRKPRKIKQPMTSPSEELGYSSEPAVYLGTEDKDTIKDLAALPKYDSGSSGLQVSQKKVVGLTKVNRKCMYKDKNIIKVEEQQMLPYIDDPSGTQVSVKEEEENQCLECNKIFPSFDLLLSHQQDHVEDQPFTCTQCPQSFSTEQYLNIHISAHAEGPPFRCLECNKTFTRRNHLGVHRRVHTGARPFACPDCPCRFRQKGSLIIHRYTHRNLQVMVLKPYQCSICSKSFKQKERLVIHERLHTGECPFSCKDCDKVFPSKSRLYVHRKMHKVHMDPSSVEQNASCKEPGGQPYQCKECDKICSTKASFVLHCKVHKSSATVDKNGSHEENLEETTNETRLASEKDLGIKTEPAGNLFSCKDCNKVCSTKAAFVLHRKVHGLNQGSDVGSQSFICKDCGKVCSTKASFVLHRKVHKSTLVCDLKANIGDPPYICQDCNKVCSTKASFVLHRKVHKASSSSEQILKTNLEQKSFVCKVCRFVCSTKASFVLHRKVHKSSLSLVQNIKDGTGEQPFACKICNKVCSTKAAFVLHCKVHKELPSSVQNLIPQADAEEKPYHCKDCGKLYSTKGRLLSHLKLHTDGDVSADSGQHLQIDTEEKPFACSICEMRFTRLKILVRHKLIHGEDVFRCIHCGKRFLFQKSLMNHLQVCLKRSKGKSLLGKEKVPKKRKIKDESQSEQSAPKKRKNENKKAGMTVQKLKNKKLMNAKKLVMNKETSKAKSGQEKKQKKPKGEAEQDPEAEGENQSDGKQEKPLETVSKEKETGKDKKPKNVDKVKKILKKVPLKQKRQKVGSDSLKKWRIIAAATVKKRKLQAVISGGKKKVVNVKKKVPCKAKTGGKNSKE